MKTTNLFYPKFSKHIIDKIDDILANYYGFKLTKSFIESFDEQFRMVEVKENILNDNLLSQGFAINTYF